MKLIHHVKKHWKTITLHLKKHHKKYIFWILSFSLLLKWISLMVAHVFVHNLLFADTLHQWDSNNEGGVVEGTVTGDVQDESWSQDEGWSQDDDWSHDEGWSQDGGWSQDDGWAQEDWTQEDWMQNDWTQDDLAQDNWTQEDLVKVDWDQKDWEKNDWDQKDWEKDDWDQKDWEKVDWDQKDWEKVDWDQNVWMQDDWTQESWQWIKFSWAWWESWEWEELNSNCDEWDGVCNVWTDWDEQWWSVIWWESSVLDWIESNWICDRWDIEIVKPIGWDIVWWVFDITWKFLNNDCDYDSYVVQLWEWKAPYLKIFTWDYSTTWFSFDSRGLKSNYYTWYKISIVVGDSDSFNTIYRENEWWEFTIDNKKPEISNVKAEYSTKNSKLNIWDTITISFESDEELKGVTVYVLWQSALFESKNWNKYTYTMDFSDKNTEWKVVYWIEYSDNIWNTWYYEWYENIELDYKTPIISNFEFVYLWWREIKLKYLTNENTNSHFIYELSWYSKTNAFEASGKNYEFIIWNIAEGFVYKYSISIADDALNTLYIWWTFFISWNNVIFTNNEISKSDLVTEIWFNKVLDEDESMNALKLKLNTLGSCLDNVEFINLNLPINWKTSKIKIPKFFNKNINEVVNAFIVELFKRIEKKDLSQSDLDVISEDLGNFLIIVKLVKEDNNVCKQNMTYYYINRFKKTLTNYWIIK